ncbi:hypothetical protein LTR08_003733 [Meristemomyces frigidus]|nr:hypothetical protein LTR08_003733 [Meristemomyces frigidus]
MSTNNEYTHVSPDTPIPSIEGYFNFTTSSLEANTVGQTLAAGIKRAHDGYPRSNATTTSTKTVLKFVIDAVDEQPLQLYDDMKSATEQAEPSSIEYFLLSGIAQSFGHRAYCQEIAGEFSKVRFCDNGEQWMWVLRNVLDTLEDGEELDGHEGDDDKKPSSDVDDEASGDDDDSSNGSADDEQ